MEQIQMAFESVCFAAKIRWQQQNKLQRLGRNEVNVLNL